MNYISIKLSQCHHISVGELKASSIECQHLEPQQKRARTGHSTATSQKPWGTSKQPQVETLRLPPSVNMNNHAEIHPGQGFSECMQCDWFLSAYLWWLAQYLTCSRHSQVGITICLWRSEGNSGVTRLTCKPSSSNSLCDSRQIPLTGFASESHH